MLQLLACCDELGKHFRKLALRFIEIGLDFLKLVANTDSDRMRVSPIASSARTYSASTPARWPLSAA
jgi:hypothetical protein